MCILNKNNSRLRGIPPEETFGILLKQGSMCKSELHSSVHFRRTPEILQRSKGRRYKIKYMNGKNSSESYRCPANKISTVLDSFTFCSDDHLPHAHRNNLKPECCYQCDLSVAHGSPAQCHQLFLQPQRSQRVQRAGLCARRPRTARSPGAPALPPPLPGPLPPAVPPCPGEAAPERPPRVAAPDTGAGTGRWPGRGADGAGSGPGRAPSPFSPCPQGPRAQSSGMEAGWGRDGGSAPPAPRCPQRQGRCCLPGLASVRAAAPRLPGTKRGAGGRQERRGGLGLLCFSFSSSSSRLGSPGPAGTRSPGRAGAGGAERRRRRSRAVSRCGRREEEPALRRASGGAASRSAPGARGSHSGSSPARPGRAGVQHGLCAPGVCPLRVCHGPGVSPASIKSVLACLGTGGHARLTWTLLNFGKG